MHLTNGNTYFTKRRKTQSNSEEKMVLRIFVQRMYDINCTQ